MKPDTWTKSPCTDNACVEVMWRTSNQYDANGGSCVEVGFAKVVRRDDVEVRDDSLAHEQSVRQ